MKRIQMITGHYGSGKTEYAVNLALRLAAEGKKTVLADLLEQKWETAEKGCNFTGKNRNLGCYFERNLV